MPHNLLHSPEARLAATRHISRRDPLLRPVIRQAGTFALEPQHRRTPFESLARAIAHQQLNGTAAQSILRRMLALFPGRKFPRPADLDTISDTALRGAGFSHGKIAALRDLSAITLAGIVPSNRVLVNLDDEEIISRLTEVRGIGRWTVEMLLIFQLGRADVLPVDDFGVRNGFRMVQGQAELPKPKAVLAYGERWRPYRTAAAWYLWRAVDLQAKTKYAAP
jgi:DNA-3-methyladenine glycosylase II